MIPTSPEFKQAIQGPHTAVARVDVVVDDAFVRTLEVHSGSVDSDRNSNILRRFNCSVSDPYGDLTPQGIKDLLAPFGTILKLYRGVKLQKIDRVSRVYDTQAQWAEGTRDGTSAADDGSLVLGSI